MKKKFLLNFAITIVWIGFVVISGLVFYVNHYLPHGPSYSTGEYVCINDDRGPCSLEYKEYLRNLNIPNWAKFFKKSEGELLWMGLLFLGMILPAYRSKDTLGI
jgi:hypothetical protein